MRRFWSLLLALVVALLPGIAQADDATAEALFLEGQKLFEAGDIDAACAKFEASVNIDRATGTMLNLARCHEKQGRSASAWAEYREASDRARREGDTERADGAAELAGALEPKLTKLLIEPPAEQPPGFTVQRDGVKLEPGALGTAVPVDPGEHQVVAMATSHREWSQVIDVSGEGATISLQIGALEPLPDTPPTEPTSTQPRDEADDVGGPSALRVGGVVLGSVGIVSIAVGSVLGVLTLQDVAEAKDDPTLCPDMECFPKGRERIDSADMKGLTSTVLIFLGIGMVAGGTIMIALGGRDDTTDAASLTPYAGPDGGGLTVIGHF